MRPPPFGIDSRDALLVSGPAKREILARVPAGANLAAAHAHSADALVWLVDRDAALEHPSLLYSTNRGG